MPLDRSDSFTYRRVHHYYDENGEKVLLTKEQIKSNKNERRDADEHGLIKLWIVSPFTLDFDKSKNSN